MAAKNFMSSILDELMGRDRNALPDEKPKTVSWDDPDICTHYLVSFCPNELFVNTKADLGQCTKVHDEQLRKKYLEEAPIVTKLRFENEFIRFADRMVHDIEGKIKRGKMRIALANGPDGGTYAGPGSKNAEKIALLTDRINVLLKEAEEAGCEGEIEKAQGLLKLCDQLKEERDQMKANEVNHPWNPDKAMQVCEVCGSYLIIGEAQHRLDDHIMGKQHMGFALLRKTMDDVKKSKDAHEIELKERAEKEKKDRDRKWGREKEVDRKDRHRDRRRSRSRSRDKKRKDKDEKRRSRSKSPRRRSRSRDKRDKDRKHRDFSRDRKSRKHSDSDKDRDKDRKRSKRSRSRSRDKHRRNRSKSRSRDKDNGKIAKNETETNNIESGSAPATATTAGETEREETVKNEMDAVADMPTTTTDNPPDGQEVTAEKDTEMSEEAEFQEAFNQMNDKKEGNPERGRSTTPVPGIDD